MKAAVRLNRKSALSLTALAIAAALMLGWLLVRTAEGQQYLVATRDLAAGEPFAAGDFTQVTLKLPADTGYVSRLPARVTLSHAIRQGELLNVADLGVANTQGTARLALVASQPVASDVRVGASVSIWFMPTNSMASLSKPTAASAAGLIAQNVEVLQISRGTDSLGATKTQLEVRVATDALPAILALQANSGALSVVAQN